VDLDSIPIFRALFLIPLIALAGVEARAEGPMFRKVRLTDKFWAEGVAIGDLNRDGHNDIVAGPYWYEGPDFTQRHTLFPARQTFKVRKDDGTELAVEGYEGALGKNNAYSESFLSFIWDLNGDGWPDVLNIGFPGKEAIWYENPGRAGLAQNRPWKRHVVFAEVGNESPAWVDLFGDGRPVLLCMAGDSVGYVDPDWAHPAERWTFYAIAPPLALVRALPKTKPGGRFNPFIHGLGCGDVNGDGRRDVLGPDGWWEQPASGRGASHWRFHHWPFLRERPTDARGVPLVLNTKWPYSIGGAQIYAYDVNGDGRPDIISSLDAHGYGLAWFEQLPGRDAAGEMLFKTHMLMGETARKNKYGLEFTEMHAIALADIDGDGLMDIVTGKRFWAHGPHGADPESNAPAVLYWFKLVRNSDQSVDFVPHLIDDDSGVGTQLAVGPLQRDGRPDIAVSNKKGTFVFLHD
jgi:hypothetical protein